MVMPFFREFGVEGPLVETDDEGAVDVDDGDAHLAGAGHHVPGRVSVLTDVHGGERDAFVLEILFYLGAPGARGGRVNFDFHGRHLFRDR